MITIVNWKENSHAARYKDVLKDSSGLLIWTIEWLNESKVCSLGLTRQQRMEISEIHFNMPALAGILVEFEAEEKVREYFKTHTPEESTRFRQAIGVLIKLHMENMGWTKARIKGVLGRRDKSRSSSYQYNTSRSFSKYFSLAERYIK
jgi:hypothetical protein